MVRACRAEPARSPSVPRNSLSSPREDSRDPRIPTNRRGGQQPSPSFLCTAALRVRKRDDLRPSQITAQRGDDLNPRRHWSAGACHSTRAAHPAAGPRVCLQRACRCEGALDCPASAPIRTSPVASAVSPALARSRCSHRSRARRRRSPGGGVELPTGAAWAARRWAWHDRRPGLEPSREPVAVGAGFTAIRCRVERVDRSCLIRPVGRAARRRRPPLNRLE